MGELTTEQRNKLPKGAFAIPERRAYPIHNAAHARDALARVHAYGTGSEIKRVEAAVHKKFPSIGKEK